MSNSNTQVVGGYPVWLTDFPLQLIAAIDAELKAPIAKLDETNGWDSPVFMGMDTTGRGYHRISRGGFDGNFIRDNRLAVFTNALVDQVILYLRSINSEASENKFYIAQSWLTDTKKGEYASAHVHTPSDISGVYYVKGVSESGSIRLLSPTSHLSASLPFKGAIQSLDFKVAPRVGRLLLFPSVMFHDVESNRKDDRRISLSFNIDFTKTIG